MTTQFFQLLNQNKLVIALDSSFSRSHPAHQETVCFTLTVFRRQPLLSFSTQPDYVSHGFLSLPLQPTPASRVTLLIPVSGYSSLPACLHVSLRRGLSPARRSPVYSPFCPTTSLASSPTTVDVWVPGRARCCSRHSKCPSGPTQNSLPFWNLTF